MHAPVRAAVDLRLLRAALFSAVCVVLSAVGHALVSGAAVPAWAVLVCWGAVLGVSAPLAGRERSLPGIAMFLLLGQLALHMVFAAGQRWIFPVPVGSSGGTMALAGRLLCGGHGSRLSRHAAARIVQQSGIGAGGPVAGARAAPLHLLPSPAMVGAHLVVALLLGWLLRKGEAALWEAVRLSAWVARRLAMLIPLVTALALARVPVGLSVSADDQLCRLRRRLAGEVECRPESVLLYGTVVRRGPTGVVFTS